MCVFLCLVEARICGSYFFPDIRHEILVQMWVQNAEPDTDEIEFCILFLKKIQIS